jgi:D-3-phosphoglycerate dehydrogenase
MVAEMGLQLGMQVQGYDPTLSIESAWRLSSQVQKMDNIQALFSKSDIVTLHVPALPETERLINSDVLSFARKNAILLNFARAEIVDTAAIKQALDAGQLSQYISDFPTPELIGMAGVMATPHLGASTAEAEENCAVMVADQMLDFLQNGNIVNSVNFPAVYLERSKEGCRIAITNRNVPRILGSVLSVLADHDINVIDMLNKSRQEVAYNLIDVETEVSSDLETEIGKIEGVINVRMFN